MEKNKTGKPALPAGRYFKYAIGEIVLVVISILFALQINTWNQNRVDKKEESEIISKLHNEFKENKKKLEEYVVELNSEMNTHIELMALIGVSKDELLKHNLDSLLFGSLAAVEFAFEDNTIKNIMQSGQLNLLKNKNITALLNKWNALSEVRKIRMTKMDKWANDHFVPYLLSKVSFKEMDATGNFRWSGKSKIKPDYHPLFQEIEFENYLDNSLWYHQQVLIRCKETDDLINEIINATKL